MYQNMSLTCFLALAETHFFVPFSSEILVTFTGQASVKLICISPVSHMFYTQESTVILSNDNFG